MLARTLGFSLVELVSSLFLGSLVLLISFKTILLGWVGIFKLSENQRVQELFFDTYERLQKELSRAGFIYLTSAHSNTKEARRNLWITITAYPKEAENSCVLLEYDLNANGLIDQPSASNYGESFGYRLRKNSLEGQRGVKTCSGARWEKLIDEKEFVVKKLKFYQKKPSGILVEFELCSQQYSSICASDSFLIPLENYC